VVTHVSVSFSALERQFSKNLGRTPKAEIVRVQLDRVKQLLAETVCPLKKIALEAGFKHTEYMCAGFKSKFGQTPGQYRAQGGEGQGVGGEGGGQDRDRQGAALVHAGQDRPRRRQPRVVRPGRRGRGRCGRSRACLARPGRREAEVGALGQLAATMLRSVTQ